MRFYLHTLIDITQTNARRGEDPFEIKQQQNFLTMTQIIGLRVNPYFETAPTIETKDINGLGFGEEFKGKQKVWSFFFDIEYEGGLTVEDLLDDFDIVPVIGNLHETINLKTFTFRTKDSRYCNVIFQAE